MKKIIVPFCLLLLAFWSQAAIGQTKKTAENLKAAYKGESEASAKYAAYAAQAKKEGLVSIATLFEAASRAESIHAANHKKVLEGMGIKPGAVTPNFTVKTTAENLADAKSGEGYEITTMYPGFIATAKDENEASAMKSFRWAMDTEKKHMVMYQGALTAMQAKKTNGLPTLYWVCPKCGNTYDVAKPEANCSFCGTGSAKYIRFGK